jgi:hypothetical protein
MSLQTVLKIGEALRNAEDNLKYFKYVEACPYQTDKEGNKIYPFCLTIPVKEDFSFDWDNIKPTPERSISELYYLRFKTSDSDSMVKYVFGDIYFSQSAKITKDGSIESSEGGYYRLENLNHTNAAFGASSFKRGMNDYRDIIKTIKNDTKSTIQSFHESLEINIKSIEKLLANIPALHLYFDGNNKDKKLIEFISDEQILDKLNIEKTYQDLGVANLKKIAIECGIDELDDTQKAKLRQLINGSIFLHFEFPNSKQWYHFKDDFKIISDKILSDFVDSTDNGLVLKKTLYKTLCSGDKKNDIQFPHFNFNYRHKAKSFTDNDLQNLFYGIDYSSKGKQLSNTDIKIIVLPIGDSLEEQDYREFYEKRDEARLTSKNASVADSDDEPLFDFADDLVQSITAFDLIFCKKGGLTSPDSDLIEISGIQKSKLKLTKEQIETVEKQIYQERKLAFRTTKDLSHFKIESSFRNILGNPQADFKTGKVSIKANPKYESHLLKVLPLIYTDNYYHDDALISSFLQNVEYSIRSGDEKYSFFKYDLKFLFNIQNYKIDKFMEEIQNSESYRVGLKLGRLSKPLKKAINSFEKNYVGLLSRRVSTKDDCMKFYNEINEKLIMHNKTWGQSSAEIASELVSLPILKYDKEKFAFGFLEGYFKYEPTDKKKDFFIRIEKLLADYEGNDDLKEEIEQLSNLFQEIKN